MKKLHEITRAILTHEKEEFDKTFTLSQIKELDNLVEENYESCGYTYIESGFTQFTYVALRQDEIEDIWTDSLIDLADDCYISELPEHLKKYFDYDKFVEDCKEDGRAHHFNGYDGNTELETDNYFIYYHNKNYKRG